MPLRSQAEFLMTGAVPVPPHPHSACSTCLESLAEDVVKMVKCGHIFHCTCILQWFQSTNPMRGTCPNCRTQLFKPDPLNVSRVQHSSMQGFIYSIPDSVAGASPGQWPPTPRPARIDMPYSASHRRVSPFTAGLHTNLGRRSPDLRRPQIIRRPSAHRIGSGVEQDFQNIHTPRLDPADSRHASVLDNPFLLSRARRRYPIRDMLATLPTEDIELMLRGEMPDRARRRYEEELELRRLRAEITSTPLTRQQPYLTRVEEPSNGQSNQVITIHEPDPTLLNRTGSYRSLQEATRSRSRPILRQSISSGSTRRSRNSGSMGQQPDLIHPQDNHEDLSANNQASQVETEVPIIQPVPTSRWSGRLSLLGRMLNGDQDPARTQTPAVEMEELHPLEYEA